jgi:hypothetical protein
MTDTKNDPGSPEATRQRAKEGQEMLGSRVAQGEPGQKQPAHDDPRLSASKTVEKLNEIVKDFEAETYEASDKRSQSGGNLNPIPPHERSISRGPQVLAAAATAAGAIGAARDSLTQQLEADARLVSDPRYERDQKVYELGVQGKLAGIAPAPAEAAAQVARTGLPPEIAKLVPKTPEEEVEQDMPRLEEVEERPQAGVAATLIEPGQQEITEKNNIIEAEEQGKTRQEAVDRAKAADSAPTPPNSGNIIK